MPCKPHTSSHGNISPKDILTHSSLADLWRQLLDVALTILPDRLAAMSRRSRHHGGRDRRDRRHGRGERRPEPGYAETSDEIFDHDPFAPGSDPALAYLPVYSDRRSPSPSGPEDRAPSHLETRRGGHQEQRPYYPEAPSFAGSYGSPQALGYPPPAQTWDPYDPVGLRVDRPRLDSSPYLSQADQAYSSSSGWGRGGYGEETQLNPMTPQSPRRTSLSPTGGLDPQERLQIGWRTDKPASSSGRALVPYDQRGSDSANRSYSIRPSPHPSSHPSSSISPGNYDPNQHIAEIERLRSRFDTAEYERARRAVFGGMPYPSEPGAGSTGASGNGIRDGDAFEHAISYLETRHTRRSNGAPSGEASSSDGEGSAHQTPGAEARPRQYRTNMGVRRSHNPYPPVRFP